MFGGFEDPGIVDVIVIVPCPAAGALGVAAQLHDDPSVHAEHICVAAFAPLVAAIGPVTALVPPNDTAVIFIGLVVSRVKVVEAGFPLVAL